MLSLLSVNNKSTSSCLCNKQTSSTCTLLPALPHGLALLMTPMCHSPAHTSHVQGEGRCLLLRIIFVLLIQGNQRASTWLFDNSTALYCRLLGLLPCFLYLDMDFCRPFNALNLPLMFFPSEVCLFDVNVDGWI